MAGGTLDQTYFICLYSELIVYCVKVLIKVRELKQGFDGLLVGRWGSAVAAQFLRRSDGHIIN